MMVKTKSRFSLTYKDPELDALIENTPHKTLAIWSADCAERVLPWFEEQFPQDVRPRQALAVCRTWIATGVFRMADIRKASLDAHAAARAVGIDSPARSAARAAGQAVATAHVVTHAIGGSLYALQAVHRAANPEDADAAVAVERTWQTGHLRALRQTENGAL
ncbi:MAG: putative immunity protein [Litorilinea sp.]